MSDSPPAADLPEARFLADDSAVPSLTAVRAFLVDALHRVPTLPAPSFSLHPGRGKVLCELHLWLAVLLAATTHSFSQTAVHHQLAHPAAWPSLPAQLSASAIAKRLNNAKLSVLDQLFVHVLGLLTARLTALLAIRPVSLAPFAAAVVAIDQTTLDRVARRLDSQRGLVRRDPALLLGKLNAVFDLRLQLWRSVVRVTGAHTNEKATVRDLLTGLVPGTLIVTDLGYFSFVWFDELTNRGFWWVSRMREKTSYTIVHRYYENGDTLDALIELGAYRADRAAHRVRLVQFRHGKVLRRYLTNVLNPETFTLLEITQVYARRWDIEQAFDLVKTHLKLHVLWSSKLEVVWLQVWAVLIVSQILSALRWEIALAADAAIEEISMELLVRYAPEFADQGQDIVAWFVTHGRRLGLIRRSRRIVQVAPMIPLDAIQPAPPGLLAPRKPRQSKGKRNTVHHTAVLAFA